MIRILFGIFIVLHGLVHVLYFGQSARYFELQPGMAWPDGSWLFSRFLSQPATRNLASISLLLAAILFITGGVGIFLKLAWWQAVVVSAAAFSTAIYILLWDGGMQNLDNKGGIGILINLAILVALLIFHWPKFDF
jgi:uncharacterized membrane protein YphA (DoxX/SURF4 family)